MNLLIQSRSNGEHLYPYLAGLFAGYLKSQRSQYYFIDLNKSNNPIKYESYDHVYIFVSWVSIGEYKNNLREIHKLILKIGVNSKITVFTENYKVYSFLIKQKLNIKIKFLSCLIGKDKIQEIKTDYTIADPHLYLSSIFFKSISVPILTCFPTKEKNVFIYRSKDSLSSDLEEAIQLFKVQNFIVEDSIQSNSDEFYLDNWLSALEEMNFKGNWIHLGGINISHCDVLDMKRVLKTNCLSFSVEMSAPHEFLAINRFVENLKYSSIYVRLEGQYKCKSILLILKSIILRSTINHYYYESPRETIMNILSFFGYILSLVNLKRCYRIYKVLKMNKNNRLKKFILKMRRLFS